MNSDGSGQTSLSNGIEEEEDERASWSLDGRKIMFERYDVPNDSFSIWVMNADGTGQTNVSHGTSDFDPAGSPDGTKIVFESLRNVFDNQIYVMNADGTGQTNISNSDIHDVGPDWQPLPRPSDNDIADFNGHGYEDLAIGVFNEDVSSIVDAGAVNIIYGSSSGLSATFVPDQLFVATQFINDEPVTIVDLFGWQLASTNSQFSYRPGQIF